MQLLTVLATAAPLAATEVIDLYDRHGVSYDYNCHRREWLAYYHTYQDKIHLRRGYGSTATFNHTALHELGHWARASHRLGPVGGSNNCADAYEEVVVEISAMILADALKLPRQSHRVVKEYVWSELSQYHLSKTTICLFHDEVHRTVEYLLGEQYPRERLMGYFNQLGF